MGDAEPILAAKTDEPSFWDSFRENTLETPPIAIAFFDLVCGQEPNWDAPDVPWLRRILEKKNKISSETNFHFPKNFLT